MSKGVSSKVVFKTYCQGQDELFPRSLDSMVPSDHPARLISRIIDGIDLKNIEKDYKGGGASSFHPRMLIKVIVYCYMNNIYSCRCIAKALQENVPLMWLSGNQQPDFRTINRFRADRLSKELEHIFKTVVEYSVTQGLLSLDVNYVDGTKIESVANRYTFVWRKNVERNLSTLKKNVESLIQDIRKVIASDEVSSESESAINEIDQEYLSKTIAELNDKLSKCLKNADKIQKREIGKAKTKIKHLQDKHIPKLLEYKLHLETLGHRNSYSKTDKDATFMRTKDDHLQTGQLKPCFNIQISTNNQIITHYTLHQNAGDPTTLPSHLESFHDMYNQFPKAISADSAYGSLENSTLCEKHNIKNFMKFNTFHIEKTAKYQADISKQENLYYNKQEDYYVCPMGQRMDKTKSGVKKTNNGYEYEVDYYSAINCNGCSMRGKCHKGSGNREIEVSHELQRHKNIQRENLYSSEGIRHRKNRGIDVETTFGDIKRNMGFTRFSMCGLEKVSLEFGLIALGHNLRKIALSRENTSKSPLTPRNIPLNAIFYLIFKIINPIILYYCNKTKSNSHLFKYA